MGPEVLSYPAACASQYPDVWKEAMRVEFDELTAAGTFSKVTTVSEGCKIVGVEWIYKLKGDPLLG